MIGRLANSPAAPSNIDTSTEDTARLGFEAGDSAFMLNYTFALGSATANAPDVAKNMGSAKFPEVVDGTPSRAAARRLQPRRQRLLGAPRARLRGGRLPFERGEPADRDRARRPAALAREPLPGEGRPGRLSGVRRRTSRRSIADAAPRPQTPAYTDLSLAIQRTLHPPQKIDPDDPGPMYDELRDKVEDAVKREGLL